MNVDVVDRGGAPLPQDTLQDLPQRIVDCMAGIILVAGASGALGFEVVKLLKSQGYTVRALCHSETGAKKLTGIADQVTRADAVQADSLRGICDGVSAVISCLGASVATGHSERRGYSTLDLDANRNLLREAERAGVPRFVYTAVYVSNGTPGYAHTRYIRAHEAVVDVLRQSKLDVAIVRPTGFYTAMEEFVDIARMGVMPLIGGGHSSSNPIHPADLAAVCVEAMLGKPGDYPAGGPEVMTRKQIGELAFAAVGKRPIFIPVPSFLVAMGAKLVGLFHPRMGEFLEFVSAVTVTDCVAPATGTRTLGEHFKQVASAPKPIR